MSPHDPASAYYEFGPFRLERASRSLYKGGDFIPVTPKALDTLFVLVEHAGRVVTKEEVMQRVWPDAFVEEGSIANNISILRKILNPHFDDDGPIATVARRGYRFTVPVQLTQPDPKSLLTTKSGRLTPEAAKAIEEYVKAHPPEPAGEPAQESLPPPAPSPPRQDAAVLRSPLTIAAAVVAIVAVIGIAAVMRRDAGGAASPTVRRSVAVLPMKNLSGDAAQDWLSSALSETISAELAGGNHFRIVSGENVMRMQQELAPPMGVGLTRKQLDDIGRDLACDLILTGNYLLVGRRIRVDVRLDEVATGEAIASASVTDAADRFLDIVAKAGADLRTALKIDPQTPADADAMRASFGSTPVALRNYFQGLEALRLRDGPGARDFLLAAVEADADFALAHAALSSAWRLLGYDKRGAESAKRALDLSARLSREDRLSVEAQYHEATSSWPKAIELYQQLWTLYPDNIEYGLRLANAQWLGGRSADTLKTVDELRKLPERDARDTRIDLLEATAADVLSDYPRAVGAAARAADKAKASNAKLMLARARIKQGIYAIRTGKLDEGLAWARESEALFAQLKDVGGEADAIRWQGGVALDRGRIDEAQRAYDRAFALAAPLDYVRLSSTIQAGLASVYRLKGDLDRAVLLAEQSVKSARECGDRTLLATALTSLGTALRFKGDLTGARAMHDQAADEAEAIGELRSRNIAINNSAVIDFLVGDLAAARRKHERILEEERKQSPTINLAIRLANLSRILVLQDQLPEAEALNQEECRLQESFKAAVGLAWCRARLAEIHLERGRKDEAESTLALIKTADFGGAVNAPVYIARYARVQLALGHVAAAADAIAAAERVQQQAGAVDDQVIQVAAVRAAVDAAQGRRAAALSLLQRTIADADRRGLKTFAFDARLVLASLDPSQAAAIAASARDAGFNLIARKAARLPRAASSAR